MGKRKKLGLACGCGGSKGIALVGALKAFEEEGIQFDVVAGTSIGSVVGAMVAFGYSSDDMLGLVDRSGLKSVSFAANDVLVEGSTLEFARFLVGDKGFSDTKLPFAAVATDLDTGEEVLLTEGDMPEALAASCAIPPVFRPIKRDGRRLVDGAFVNAVPADVVRRLGADVVISINLSHIASNCVGKNALDGVYPENGVKEGDRLHQAYEFSDIVISPDLAEFSTSDITRLDEMYSIGYDEAKLNMDAVKKLLRTHGLLV